jgi:large subunit ribosomal protein L4
MKVDIVNIKGSSTGRSLELPADVFGIEPNEHVLYLAVKQYLAAQRQGTHKAKEKNEVWRTTKKFKKQKGTGGARAGSLKSPIQKGGGTVFGPRPRSYDFSLNKKVKTLAKFSALSHKASSGSIVVVEDFTFDAPKTKQFVDVAKGLGFSRKTLVVLPDYDSNVYLSGRNLPDTSIVSVNDLNTYQVMNASKVVFLESSIAKVK